MHNGTGGIHHVTAIAGNAPQDREAYSHEVISFGFWAGDAAVPTPTFYSYTYPEPDDLTTAPLRWSKAGGGTMALLDYDDLRRVEDPRGALLNFLESAYLAGATHANWDVGALRHDYADDAPLVLP